ncbi:MAG: M14 family zinc carboxypeptidase [Acidobacteriota bacterium]
MRLFFLFLLLASQSPEMALTPDQLWRLWPDERFVRTSAPCLRPSEVEVELARLSRQHPKELCLEVAGHSFEGRPIHLLKVGHGPRTVLLWSQMHGDEPSATPALLDIAAFLSSHAQEPKIAAMLEELTLVMIPMLNPDGAEVYQRRNAQGIDINRDALHLSTPEGRILKSVRDDFQPILGFNLHDQDRRLAAGESTAPATIALLAVAGDPEGILTAGRLRAQRACSAIAHSLGPIMPDGGISRFNEDWNPRAFGDNITAWGTPVVLIESGGLPPGHALEDLSRLNFVAILTVLQALAQNDLHDFDPQIYQALPRNRRGGRADVIIRGGSVLQPDPNPMFRADLAFNLYRDDRNIAGCLSEPSPRSSIVEIGDTSHLGTNREVNAEGSVISVPLTVGVQGRPAIDWLKATVLTDLAAMGVGTLVWKIPAEMRASAQSVAEALAGPERTRLVLVSESEDLPDLCLSGPPEKPASRSFYDILDALIDTGDESLTSEAALQLLLASIPPAAESSLKVGRPASFLILDSPPEGRIDPRTLRLRAVYLNGSNITGGSP